MLPLTNEEISHIARESAHAAVRELLVAMGVDAHDPAALIEMQKDFAHIRRWRESVDTMRNKGLAAAVGIVITFIAGAVLLALRGH